MLEFTKSQKNRNLILSPVYSSLCTALIGISLPTNPEARYDMVVKRQAIGRFMFNMAFENSIEDGYVTEKPFDALISGPTYPYTLVHIRMSD